MEPEEEGLVPETEIELEDDAAGDEEGDAPPETVAYEPTADEVATLAAKYGYVRPEPAPQAQPNADPRLAQRNQLLLDSESLYGEERQKALNMALDLTSQIAADQAVARVLPTLGKTYGASVVRGLSSDPNAQAYLEKQFAGMDPMAIDALLQNPQTNDLLMRAAQNYAGERASLRSTNESVQSERIMLTRAEQDDVRAWEAAFGEKVTSDMLREAKKYADR